MSSLIKKIRRIGILILFFAALSGCMQDKTNLLNEAYEYSVLAKSCIRPSAVNGEALNSALTTVTQDGKFFCFTEDETTANDFVNAQRTLVQYLRNYGVKIEGLEFFGTDYGYSFSESSENAAYVAFTDMRSWQQVLVTLQAVWGDYTDYGYVYGMSNAIADELGWQTDSVPAFEQETAALFFAANPEAINLLYPTFTDKLATDETVSNSKALAIHLFNEMDWKNAVNKPIDEQLDDYYELVSAYAQELSVPFERQTCGYAYYGEDVKLRIMTSYAELIIDSNYRDAMERVYGDYWDNYLSVYQTANIINDEITAAVEYFTLQDTAGTIQINWLDGEDSNTDWLIPHNNGAYYSSTKTAYVTSIHIYLHEYYHHIQDLLNPDLGFSWQSQAFCELGASHSHYRQMSSESTFLRSEDGAKLFQDFTGRAYVPGRDDYFETMDILCYYNDYYQLEYITGAQAQNSFCRYLVDLYGERAVFDMLIFPKTVEAATEKTWEALRSEWEQHIRDKYAHVEFE